MKLCLVCARAGVCPLAALAGLATRRHGLPLQADLGVGRGAGTGAGVGWRGRRRQRAKRELTTWTAGQLCAETGEKQRRTIRTAKGEGGGGSREINIGLLGAQYHKLQIKVAC